MSSFSCFAMGIGQQQFADAEPRGSRSFHRSVPAQWPSRNYCGKPIRRRSRNARGYLPRSSPRTESRAKAGSNARGRQQKCRAHNSKVLESVILSSTNGTSHPTGKTDIIVQRDSGIPYLSQALPLEPEFEKQTDALPTACFDLGLADDRLRRKGAG